MPEASTKRPVVFSIALIVLGVLGFIAAFALTLDKFDLLTNPQADLSCDVSVLVQCSKNLNSAQGAVFGFPNPLMGIAGWVAPIVAGVALLSGARFAKWFWFVFNLGFVFALGLVIYLITESIFVLGTLCPWCMLTWAVVIPSFFLVTTRNLANLPSNERMRRFGRSAQSWVPVISIVCYIGIAVIAQLRLDVLSTL